MNFAASENKSVKTSETDFEKDFSHYAELAKTHVLTVSESENIFYGQGRNGRIPDVVIFGFLRGKMPENGTDGMPHYVIYKDGSVKQFVGLSGVSKFFETPSRSSGEYFGKGGGLVFNRKENVSLYSVSVAFEGDCLSEKQILSAASLLRLISLRLLRLHGKKLPTDNNHIISAADPGFGYKCETDTALITELCKLRPV